MKPSAVASTGHGAFGFIGKNTSFGLLHKKPRGKKQFISNTDRWPEELGALRGTPLGKQSNCELNSEKN